MCMMTSSIEIPAAQTLSQYEALMSAHYLACIAEIHQSTVPTIHMLVSNCKSNQEAYLSKCPADVVGCPSALSTASVLLNDARKRGENVKSLMNTISPSGNVVPRSGAVIDTDRYVKLVKVVNQVCLEDYRLDY